MKQIYFLCIPNSNIVLSLRRITCTEMLKGFKELQRTKQELLESQKSVANLNLELNACKNEKDDLFNLCKKYQSDASKTMEVTKQYEVDIRDLEEQLSCLQRELCVVKEQSEVNEYNNCEMKLVLKNKADMLKKEGDQLKDVIERYEADANDYKTKIVILEEKLSCSEKNRALVLEQLQMKLSSYSDIQKEMETYKSKIKVLEKSFSDASERLKKAKEEILCYLQEQLKDVQRSYDQKITAQEEQHEIEVQQTMKLKHPVEEENINLKKQKLKSSDSRLESVDTIASEVNKQRSRKRVSDEDFVLSSENIAKKMKPEVSKIPVKRTTRRKLQSDDTENISPIQKITKSITSKVRVLSNNIPSHIPRYTGRRKKPFHAEAQSSSQTEKAKN